MPADKATSVGEINLNHAREQDHPDKDECRMKSGAQAESEEQAPSSRLRKTRTSRKGHDHLTVESAM